MRDERAARKQQAAAAARNPGRVVGNGAPASHEAPLGEEDDPNMNHDFLEGTAEDDAAAEAPAEETVVDSCWYRKAEAKKQIQDRARRDGAPRARPRARLAVSGSDFARIARPRAREIIGAPRGAVRQRKMNGSIIGKQYDVDGKF